MIDPFGTIGPAPCEKKLNKILAEHNDPKMINKVTKRYCAVKHNIKKLTQHVLNNDPTFFLVMLNILREHTLKHLDAKADRFPTEVYTHLRCCITGVFTAAYAEHAKLLKELKSIKG